MVSFLFCTIILLTVNSQEPTKKQKKERKEQVPAHVYDTTTVSVAKRAADTLYMEQSIVLNKLDSLIQEKQKK